MSEPKAVNESNVDDVFITDVFIRKVRHLENIHIPLSETERKHLILTGKSGSGKTAVMEMLKTIIEYGNLNIELRRVFKSGINYDKSLHVMKLNGVDLSLLNPGKLSDLLGKECQFAIGHFGADRQVEMRVPTGIEKLSLGEYGRTLGSEFVQYIVNLKAERAFAMDDNDSKTAKKIDEWFELFENLLRELFEDESITLEFDRRNFKFRILQSNREFFDFNTLSGGYSATINVLTELILRMKAWNFDMQGVVLIDEVEAHLHLGMQKKILPFLTSFFPRIQFIVTTHSPFVLNSIENAVIYDLEKQLLVSDLSGYSYVGIVEGYFNNDQYSNAVKQRIEAYQRLVRMEKRTEEEDEQMFELRRYLKDVPDSFAPGLKSKFMQIELDRFGEQHD